MAVLKAATEAMIYAPPTTDAPSPITRNNGIIPDPDDTKIIELYAHKGVMNKEIYISWTTCSIQQDKDLHQIM